MENYLDFSYFHTAIGMRSSESVIMSLLSQDMQETSPCEFAHMFETSPVGPKSQT